jgi:hypothetical protein
VTTLRRQADYWANDRVKRLGPGREPAVIEFIVSRDALAQCQTLSFARGDYYDTEYWGFVWRCRMEGTDHARAVNGGWYDLVHGPVAMDWRQRQASRDYDQMSFHTFTAIALLDASPRKRVYW